MKNSPNAGDTGATGVTGEIRHVGEVRDPAHLNGEERETWDAFVSVLVQLPAALDAQLQHDSSLSHFEYQVMAVLSEHPERRMRLSDIARRIGSALPRLSQVASRLEKRGWITRTTDPSDGRYTLAALTQAGMDTVIAAAPGHAAAVRRLVFDALTKAQQRQLHSSARRMNAAIEAERQRLG